MPLSRDAIIGVNALANLAGIYMWSGHLEEAIEIYKQVVALPGWTNAVDIMVDPYYDALRSHPDYPELIASVSKPEA